MQISAGQLESTILDIGVRRFGGPDLDAASVPTDADRPRCSSFPNPADRASGGGLEAVAVLDLQKIPYAFGVLFDFPAPVPIPVQPTQSEHGEVTLRDDIDRSSWAPNLAKTWVIPCLDVNVLHPGVK